MSMASTARSPSPGGQSRRRTGRSPGRRSRRADLRARTPRRRLGRPGRRSAAAARGRVTGRAGSRLILAQVSSPESGSTSPSRSTRSNDTVTLSPSSSACRSRSATLGVVRRHREGMGTSRRLRRAVLATDHDLVRAVGVLDAEGVDALGPQPRLRPRGDVLVAGSVPAAEQVSQRRVAVGVRLQVLDHAGDERLVAEVGVELPQRGGALAVGDAVEVGQRLLGVPRAVAGDRVGRRALVGGHAPGLACRRRTRPRRRRTGSWSLVVR